MTNFQRELYQFYLDNISTKGEKAVNTKGRSVSGLFTDYQNLMRVWTHPKLLETHSLKREFAELLIEKVKYFLLFLDYKANDIRHMIFYGSFIIQIDA